MDPLACFWEGYEQVELLFPEYRTPRSPITNWSTEVRGNVVSTETVCCSYGAINTLCAIIGTFAGPFSYTRIKSTLLSIEYMCFFEIWSNYSCWRCCQQTTVAAVPLFTERTLRFQLWVDRSDINACDQRSPLLRANILKARGNALPYCTNTN